MHGEVGGGGNRFVPVGRNSRPAGYSNVDWAVSQTEGRRSVVNKKQELSPREFEVLVGISEGLTNSQIGKDLFLSENTIKTHARIMFKKLGARDRAHAVTLAFKTGLLSAAGHADSVDRIVECLREFAQENIRLRAAADACACPRPSAASKRELTVVPA